MYGRDGNSATQNMSQRADLGLHFEMPVVRAHETETFDVLVDGMHNLDASRLNGFAQRYFSKMAAGQRKNAHSNELSRSEIDLVGKVLLAPTHPVASWRSRGVLKNTLA